ncbi:MAG: PDZ domain-containing protein [Pseudohongiellaceae bacterium]
MKRPLHPFKTPGTALLNTLLVYFLLITPGHSQHSDANGDAGRTDPADADYFLHQPFQSDRPEERLDLNHLGASYIFKDDAYYIDAVLEGYPAHQSGLRRGDAILSVDGTAFHPLWSLNDNTRIPHQWEALNQPVQLRYRRRTAEHTVTLEPVFENLYDSYRSASLNSVAQLTSGNKLIGYVHFWALSRNTNDVITFLRIMDSLAQCDGLIVDLRGGLGYLSEAHLDAFVRGSGNEADIAAISPWSSSEPINSYNRPAVILQDADTRGGPEILARRLAPLGRIETIGGTTSGGMVPERPVDYPRHAISDPQLSEAMFTLVELM